MLYTNPLINPHGMEHFVPNSIINFVQHALYYIDNLLCYNCFTHPIAIKWLAQSRTLLYYNISPIDKQAAILKTKFSISMLISYVVVLQKQCLLIANSERWTQTGNIGRLVMWLLSLIFSLSLHVFFVFVESLLRLIFSIVAECTKWSSHTNAFIKLE